MLCANKIMNSHYSRRHALFAVVAVLISAACFQECQGFVPSHVARKYDSCASTAPISPSLITNDQKMNAVIFRHGSKMQQSTNTRLQMSKIDGSGRGTVIQVFVLAICVWIFTIPPEFRRAYICQTDGCIAERSKCNDCVTPSEWREGIAEYYKNGGGIEWNFEIGEQTKAAFK